MAHNNLCQTQKHQKYRQILKISFFFQRAMIITNMVTVDTVTVTSLPVGRNGRAEYRAPVGGRKCLVASFWTNKNATLHLWKQLCINRWVERNRVGDVSGGAIGARRTRGVARCDRLNWRRGKLVRGAVPFVFICVLLILVDDLPPGHSNTCDGICESDWTNVI